MNKERIILFGLGGKYQYEKSNNPTLFEGLNVVAFSDNNETLWHTTVEYSYVITPNEIVNTSYDRVVILSNYYEQISTQLVDLGVPQNKIIHWDEFIVENKHTYEIEKSNSKAQVFQKALLISTTLDFNGGTLALVNAGEALKAEGYSVSICGPKAREEMVTYILSKGIDVLIAPAIQYPNDSEKEWIARFDKVIVNVFQMINTAYFISQFMPVTWWLHESGESYSDIYGIIMSINYKIDITKCKNLRVYAVSNRAKAAFNEHFPSINVDVLPLGMDDFQNVVLNENHKIKTVAVIANLCPIKNQLLAIEAIRNIADVRLLLIGDSDETGYGEKVIIAASANNIEILQGKTRKDLLRLYRDIDIVLCSSLEETLSMTIIEGMMNKKICITSDATGIADYMTDGVDGYIFKSGDANDLKNKLEYVVSNWDKLDNVREAARKTYEDNFTLEKFGERIAEILCEE